MDIGKHFTYLEFIEAAQRKNVYNKKYCASKSKEDYVMNKNAGVTFKEAIRYAKGGWSAGIKQLDINEGVEVPKGVSYVQSVQGGLVNVGNYLQGIPENMWKIEPKDIKNKEIITVYCRISYRGGIKSETAMEYCKATIELVNKLNIYYNVKIIGVFDGEFNCGRIYEHVTIKGENERFVLNNIAFAFHPAFFRRLRWGYLESFKEGYDKGGTVGQTSFLQRIQHTIKGDRVICTPSVDEHAESHENAWYEIGHCKTYNINEKELKSIKELYKIKQ